VLHARAAAKTAAVWADLIEELLRDYLKGRGEPRLDCCCQDASHSPGSLPNAMLLAHRALIASFEKRRCPNSQTR